MADWSDDVSDRIGAQARRVIAACRSGGLRLATAESCTGGLVAAALTEVTGASVVVDRGFVTYSNGAKQDLLGVPTTLLDRHGAVSAEVARAMAEGALSAAPVDLSVAVTGIAGPGGATATKPVGLVHLAAARRGAQTLAVRHVFPGGRRAVRVLSVSIALDLLLAQARR